MIKKIQYIVIILFVSLLYSKGFAQWASMNGQNGSQVRCILSIPGKVYVGTANNKFNYTTNEGLTWVNSGAGLIDNGIYAMIQYGTNIVIGSNAGIFYNDLTISSDWLPTNNGLTYFSISSFAIIGTKLYAATVGGGVFISNGPGTLWTQSNTGLENLTVISLLAKGTDLYAGTSGGGIYKSTNQGTSWSAVNNGLINQYVPTMTFTGENIYCGTYGAGVFKSTNNGLSWVQVNNGLFNTTINGGLVSVGNKVIAGTQAGIFASFDNGANWIQFNTGLLDQIIRAVSLGTGTAYCGTDNAFCYKRNLSEIISVNNNSIIANPSFRLNQNYPNPFNPSTNITFSLDKYTEIKLSLYDVAGKLIKVLQEGFFNQGDYNIKVDLHELGTGIYFYSLETNERTLTQKMILAK